MDGARMFRDFAHWSNKVFMPVLHTGAGRRVLGRWLGVVSYRGRRSGKDFSFTVGYQRAGDTVTIRVLAPEAKTWWRNFLGEGGPMTLTLGSRSYDAHAVARRDARGQVSVEAVLS